MNRWAAVTIALGFLAIAFFAGWALGHRQTVDEWRAVRDTCAREIEARDYAARFPEVDQELLLDECVKYVQREGHP